MRVAGATGEDMARTKPKDWRKYYERRRAGNANKYGAYLSDAGLKRAQKYYDDLIADARGRLATGENVLSPITKRVIEDNIGQYERRREMLARKFEEARQLLDGKGSPMSVEDAMMGTNPNWTSGSMEWHNNCQRCVIVYELRRRGYDVTATKYEGWDDVARGWRRAFEGMTPVNVGSRNRQAVLRNMYNLMQSWGEGSRAIVDLDWSRGTGHVFNAEFRNGKLLLVEAQTGEYVKWSRYEASMMPTKTKMWRVDNLPPTENIVGLMKRGKK